MDIDPNQLPNDPAAWRQMGRGRLEELESKERRLKQLQHWLEQLLRYRYGPRRERVNENQLFLFAVALVSAGQEEILRRQGVDLPRQTMCDWMRGCAERASPLYELMKQRVLGGKAVQTDDTPVPVLDAALPRTRTGRIGTYVGDAEHPYTVYDYTCKRSRDGAEAFLKEFRGFLQADAYSGYDHL